MCTPKPIHRPYTQTFPPQTINEGDESYYKTSMRGDHARVDPYNYNHYKWIECYNNNVYLNHLLDFWYIELEHVLNTRLQCEGRAGTTSARSLHGQAENIMLVYVCTTECFYRPGYNYTIITLYVLWTQGLVL